MMGTAAIRISWGVSAQQGHRTALKFGAWRNIDSTIFIARALIVHARARCCSACGSSSRSPPALIAAAPASPPIATRCLVSESAVQRLRATPASPDMSSERTSMVARSSTVRPILARARRKTTALLHAGQSRARQLLVTGRVLRYTSSSRSLRLTVPA
eukprot:COSAG02_NODE_10917_length_1832_cov_1.251587_2_plen_158_part_00